MPRRFEDPLEKRLYQCWGDMKQRCYNQKLKKYRLYGGKGVKVCPKWRDSYEEFRAWAYANGYDWDLTIDRMNGDGDYCPENCKFSTYTEQARNTSFCHVIEIDGERISLGELAELTGTNITSLRDRLYRMRKKKALA